MFHVVRLLQVQNSDIFDEKRFILYAAITVIDIECSSRVHRSIRIEFTFFTFKIDFLLIVNSHKIKYRSSVSPQEVENLFLVNRSSSINNVFNFQFCHWNEQLKTRLAWLTHNHY